jgi:AcrR family transcriptional regulator
MAGHSSVKTTPRGRRRAVEPGARSDARANRLRVLEAARRAFAGRGLDAEVKDIAEGAGVGVGTVYRAFGSKTDLLIAVARRAAGEIDDLFAAAEAEPDPARALHGLLAAAVGFIDSYGWLLQLFLSGRFPDHAIFEPPERHEVESSLRRLIQRGLDAGVYRPGLDVDLAALLIQGALTSMLAPRLGKRPRAISADAFAAGVVRLLSR